MRIKKKKSFGGVRIITETKERIVIPQPWEDKLRARFCFQNNPERWITRESTNDVIAFIKEELNAPIEQYKKELAKLYANKVRIAQSQIHGGGNGRRLLEQLLSSIEDEQKEGE